MGDGHGILEETRKRCEVGGLGPFGFGHVMWAFWKSVWFDGKLG